MFVLENETAQVSHWSSRWTEDWRCRATPQVALALWWEGGPWTPTFPLLPQIFAVTLASLLNDYVWMRLKACACTHSLLLSSAGVGWPMSSRQTFRLHSVATSRLPVGNGVCSMHTPEPCLSHVPCYLGQCFLAWGPKMCQDYGNNSTVWKIEFPCQGMSPLGSPVRDTSLRHRR